ncbi:MAG TPA: PhzF family phenazine biosynthesis protein [Gemmatimonadaceae bacterium]|nr:PhzF family phenazine biosynthesis protein [Gemmatimonadaceae bacterium]
MKYRFHTADVFTQKRFGGNPLAVFPDARGLTATQMALLAREFNLSETVFVLPPADPANTRRLHIFTPGRELPFAGHPTVGAAFVLAALGEIPTPTPETRIVFEEGIGLVPVTIHSRDGAPRFTQLTVAQLPALGAPPPALSAVAAMLSLSPDDIVHDENAIQTVSCGVPFLMVPLKSREALRDVKPRADLFRATLAPSRTTEVYVFWDNGARVHARMFVLDPELKEDPATGSACASLGGYLSWHGRTARGSTSTISVEQGLDMGRPSLLEVEVDTAADGKVTGVRVGGASVLVAEGSIYSL